MIETRASLLERIRDPTNTDAWFEFVTTYQPLLTAYVRKRGIGQEDAADIVQLVFIRLITTLRQFQLDHARGRFRTWLWNITYTTLIDWYRRRATREKTENAWFEQKSRSDRSGPDEEWNLLYRRQILQKVLNRVSKTVPPASWACFQGRLLEDRPADEIAAELGISANAVYVNASRVLARVREGCSKYEELGITND